MDTSRTLKAEVIIAGAGVGGCAAALALAENGHSVIMTEEHRWIGGQFTSQAVPPDEHGWIERFGGTRRYGIFRRGIRDYYRRHYPLEAGPAANPLLNPGNGWVSPLCHEPRVALAVLHQMLSPHVSSGRLRILEEHTPRSLENKGSDEFSHLLVTRLRDGACLRLEGRYFLDATENGDLLPLGSVEHVTGSEARADTGEPSAGLTARPDNVQSLSVCFILEENHDDPNEPQPPADYEKWRNYVPKLTPPWPGRLLGWDGLNPRTMDRMKYNFHPHHEKLGLFSGLWAFRRIIDRSQFKPGFFKSDLCLVNWPMIDYMEADILGCDVAEKARRLGEARSLSLSMVHWLRTEAPRPDGDCGWPGLRLRGDLLGTDDGLAMAPYIRESRRIRALVTIREQDVSAKYRPGETLATCYEDSVGIGYYRIDLHPTTGGDNYVDVPSLPFRIPLGALIPTRVANLLPAAKNIGTTHITNGCYRLHPVEWNIGEAAGLLASYCLRENLRPRTVATSEDRVRAFQRWIGRQGIELAWPRKLNLNDGDPHAHAREP